MARAGRTVHKGSNASTQGRRFYDGSTKGVLAAGIGGGSVIGVLTSLFMFMNAAPWAAKTETEAIRSDLRRLEGVMEAHVNSPGHLASIAENATIKATMSSMQDTLKEIKEDVKAIKERKK